MIPDGGSLKILQFLSKLLLQYYTTKSRMKLAGFKVSITQKAKLFATQEKPFCQALKGVHYESSTQKCQCLDAACDKEEESSSSETEDDDDEDEGAVTKMTPLKKHKRWGGSLDKSEACDTKVTFQFSSGPFTPTSSLSYSKFYPNFPFQVSIYILAHPIKI